MRSLLYCTACVLISAVIVFAGSPDYTSLLEYLDDRHPPGIEIIASVGDFHQQKLILEKPREKPVRGEELLVLKAVDGTPPALYDTKAVIKVTAVNGSTIVARVVHTMTGSLQPGDPIARPPSPKIFLSRDIGGKQKAEAYQHLLQTLLSANYNVIETAGPESIEQTGSYGLHLRVSERPEELDLKIRSIYTPATLFSETYVLTGSSETGSTAGQTGPAAESPPRPAVVPQAAPLQARGPDTTKAQKIRLKKNFNRITTAELDGKPPEELLLLNNKGVFAYRLDGDRLTRLASCLFESKDMIGLNLHAMDIDGSGRETVFATCAKKTTYMDAEDSAIRSMALDWKNQKWVVRAEKIPFYLRVLQAPGGEEYLLGQKKKGAEIYGSPIFKVKWDEKVQAFTQGPAYPPASGIHCLYQFVFAAGSTGKVLVLEPDNHVSLYKMPEERLLDMTDVQFGPYRETAFPVRLAEKKYRGGFDEEISSKKAYAERKLLLKPDLQNQCFLIQKGRTSEGLGKRMMKLVRRETGRDRVIALRADTETLYESWASADVPRDLIDFTFFSQDKQTRLLALARDSRGYILEFLSEAQ